MLAGWPYQLTASTFIRPIYNSWSGKRTNCYTELAVSFKVHHQYSSSLLTEGWPGCGLDEYRDVIPEKCHASIIYRFCSHNQTIWSTNYNPKS